jgi:hypothetical protein
LTLHGTRNIVAAGRAQEAARRIGAAVAELGVERFDLMGEGGPGLRPPCGWLARQVIGSVVRIAPDGLPDEGFREIKRPVLVLSRQIRQVDHRDYRRHR